jgi:Valyl-tRNA synthetase
MSSFSETEYRKKLAELQTSFPDAQIDWHYEHNVAVCERSKTVIEPLISDEFFLSYQNRFPHPSSQETKYLIFDYDGVLADTNQANLIAWAKLCTENNLKQAEKLRNEYLEKARYSKSSELSTEEKELQRQFSRQICQLMAEQEFSLFTEFLEEIGKIPNTKLAIVSNGYKELLIIPKLKQCKLNFTHVLGKEDGLSKADKIAKICQDWGVSKKQVYYFTDTHTDILELENFLDKDKLIGCSWGWVGKTKLLEVLPAKQILDQPQDIHRLFDGTTNLKQLTFTGLQETQFYPADFRERGENFVQTIRDWCISRDLTWGHRIPVWYNLETNPEKQFFSYQEWLKNPEIRQKMQVSQDKPNLPGTWVQEKKILDTWFSSSLWPLSTLDFVKTVKPKKTVIIVGGGEAFTTEAEMLASLKNREIDIRSHKSDWKSTLTQQLAKLGIEVFYPQMPNKQNANYQAWTIWFEKYLAQIDPENELFLIGHSLGGNFLLKYLSENRLPVKQLHLVAACTFAPGFSLQKPGLINQNCEQVYLYHSTDDQVVPIEELNKIHQWLPQARKFVFSNRGHFNLPVFPEIEDYIAYSNYFYAFAFYPELDLPTQKKIAAHGIVYNPRTKKLLLAQINQQKISNLSHPQAVYHLIGGKLEPEETAQIAFLRELAEETGIKANQIEKLCQVGKTFWGINFRKENNVYQSRVESTLFYVETTANLTNDITDDQTLVWVDLDNLSGKIMPEFEHYIAFVLQHFSNDFTNTTKTEPSTKLDTGSNNTSNSNDTAVQNSCLSRLTKIWQPSLNDLHNKTNTETSSESAITSISLSDTINSNSWLGKNLYKPIDFNEYYSTPNYGHAQEIFYLWIVRMITLGKYFTNKIPFEHLVITPTILDEKGRKMSKSLKNGLEPGEAITKFSSDALRTAMLSGMIPGRNMRFGGQLADKLMEKYRNLGNKIWNVARFFELVLEQEYALTASSNLQPNSLAPASWWILEKYLTLEQELEESLSNYQLAHSVDSLYNFLWNQFADWYVEYLKTDSSQISFGYQLFKQFILAVSPFLPFESEVLWQTFFKEEQLLSFHLKNNSWPTKLWQGEPEANQLAEEFSAIIDFINNLRSTRGLFAIDPSQSVEVQTDSELLLKYQDYIKLMAKSDLVSVRQENLFWIENNQYSYGLDILRYVVDPVAEVDRTKKIIASLERQIATLKQQLNNPNFLNAASPEIVAEKQTQLQQRQSELAQQLNKLDFLENN